MSKNEDILSGNNLSIDTAVNITLSNLARYKRIGDMASKINIPNFNRYSKLSRSTASISLPNLDRYNRIGDIASKINIPNFDKYSKITRSTASISLPNFDKIISISETIASFQDEISNIDWEKLN